MSTLISSKNLYTKLQKQYSRKINLDLKRISLALKKLDNIHKSIKNPINIIGSDGKYSTLKSLQYFIQENKEKVSTFTSPHLYDVRHRFWFKDKFISIKEFKKNLKIIEKLKVKLTLFELLTLVYYISASKLKNVSYALVEAGLMFAGDSTRVWDKPLCQIIVNVNKQHLEWTKTKTLREICKQKVGYLSKKTTIYVGKQKPATMKIIKKILKKNPSKKNYYGNAWTLKKAKGRMIYKDNKGKLILKSKKIFSDGIWQNVGLATKVARDFNISKKNIVNALALNAVVGNGTRLAFPPIGGLIIAIYGAGPALIFGAVLYAVSSVAFLAVTPSKIRQQISQRISLLKQFYEGIHYVRHQPVVLGLILMNVLNVLMDARLNRIYGTLKFYMMI